MEEVIHKWEIILDMDKYRNMTYDRNVLIEMLNDFKNTNKQK